ncbi:MAG TPA: BTAD domain-containing putative transcriptional regulator [Armatimonadota bacterium]|jgi:predicted ATPase/DNA-binding SARP family transcriptional activator
MHEMWEVRLLGWLTATRGDIVVSRFPSHKAAALLAALAFRPERPQPREVLAEILWPEAEPDAARNRFRVALSALRRILEPPGTAPGSVLLAGRNTVQLHPDALHTDVAEFERALDEAASGAPEARGDALARAVGLYRGDLLMGFYENWVQPERERLNATYVEALIQLARAREEAGDLPGAIEAARRAAAEDPLREPAHQRLMALHLAAGDPTAAFRQYRDLRRILRREIGQPPSPATRAIAETIRARLRARPEVVAAKEAPAPSRPRQAFAHPPSAAAPRLPMFLTRFFGRDAEMAALEGLLTGEAARLVTLTGAGGSGKTRLAVEAAKRLQAAFAGGVWFVPMADRDDARLLGDAIFDAMRLRRIPGVEPMEQVESALSRVPALLVLDNFEHLAAAGAVAVRALLERAPAVRCLVTSQAPLRLAGEREVPLSPLAAPAGDLGMEALAACPSVKLFVDRAQAVRPEFAVTGRNAESVAAICRRLEGLPLAIELAAAWAHMLTPAEMLERLDSRFDLLVARGADAADRHRALWTTLDWSFQLLTEPLRRLFARLSVFRSGWTLEAAREVCEEPEALERLAALRERSFLLARDCGVEMCFSMLVSLREYAAGRLPPEERAILARRHADYYRRLSMEAEAALHGPGVEEWLERLDNQHENLLAALEHGLEPAAEPGLAAHLAAALAMYWEHRGRLSEGRKWLALALGATQEPRLRLPALNAAARLAVVQGDAHEGEAYATEALAIAEATGDIHEEALVFRNLAFVDFIRADYARSVMMHERSLALFRRIGDDWGIAAVLDDFGSVLCRTGEYDRARALFEESLEVYRRLKHCEGVASALFGLGVLERDLGEYAAARPYLEQTLAAGREMKDRLCVALASSALGTVAALSGDIVEGRARLEESEALFRELRDNRGLFFTYYHLGATVLRHTDPARAAEIHREGAAMAYRGGDPRYTLYNTDALALLAADRGDAPLAASLMGWAEAYRTEIGHPWPPYLHADRERALAGVRAALPDDEFRRLWAAGADLTLEAAMVMAGAPAPTAPFGVSPQR